MHLNTQWKILGKLKTKILATGTPNRTELWNGPESHVAPAIFTW